LDRLHSQAKTLGGYFSYSRMYVLSDILGVGQSPKSM